MKEQVQDLKSILEESNRIVFFGGAGVSTASNIPDFRSASGIFNETLRCTLTPEQLVSHSYFVRYPKEFYEFYKEKLIYPEPKPNNCHYALARLEKMGKLKAIITQNIDGLHQVAGSEAVYELHGSVHRSYCMKCHTFYDAAYILQAEGIPSCTKCGGTIKPDVVLYEEALDQNIIEASVSAIRQADTLIIGGTSLVVYPAAGLIDYFHGKHLVLINKEATKADKRADLVLHEDIATILWEAVEN